MSVATVPLKCERKVRAHPVPGCHSKARPDPGGSSPRRRRHVRRRRCLSGRNCCLRGNYWARRDGSRCGRVLDREAEDRAGAAPRYITLRASAGAAVERARSIPLTPPVVVLPLPVIGPRLERRRRVSREDARGIATGGRFQGNAICENSVARGEADRQRRGRVKAEGNDRKRRRILDRRPVRGREPRDPGSGQSIGSRRSEEEPESRENDQVANQLHYSHCPSQGSDARPAGTRIMDHDVPGVEQTERHAARAAKLRRAPRRTRGQRSPCRVQRGLALRLLACCHPSCAHHSASSSKRPSAALSAGTYSTCGRSSISMSTMRRPASRGRSERKLRATARRQESTRRSADLEYSRVSGVLLRPAYRPSAAATGRGFVTTCRPHRETSRMSAAGRGCCHQVVC
jgi:hypothetical protein